MASSSSTTGNGSTGTASTNKNSPATRAVDLPHSIPDATQNPENPPASKASAISNDGPAASDPVDSKEIPDEKTINESFTAEFPSNLPTPPFINVHGIPNFRDLGGYACAAPPGSSDASSSKKYMVRRFLLFRCAHPTQVSTSGAITMRNKLGITDIYDLRSAPEIARLAASGAFQASPTKPQQKSSSEQKPDKQKKDEKSMSNDNNYPVEVVEEDEDSSEPRQRDLLTHTTSDPNTEPVISTNGTVMIPGITRHFTPVYEAEDYSPVALAKKLQWYTASNSEGTDYSDGFVKAYRDIASHGVDAYAKILRRILQVPEEIEGVQEGEGGAGKEGDQVGGGGLVFHCTAGKDRTGVIAAVVLRLCGVDDETICWEYAITEPGLGTTRDLFIKRIAKGGLAGPAKREDVSNGGGGSDDDESPLAGGKGKSSGGVSRAEAARICGSRAANMRAWLKNVLDDEFGGVENYLVDMVGLKKEEVEDLKRKLIVEVKDGDSVVEPVSIDGWTLEDGMLKDK